MKRFIANISSGETDMNGNRISAELMLDLIEKQPKVPVRLNFGGAVIGSTVSYSMGEKGIFCDFEASLSPELIEDSLYLVPIFGITKMHKEARSNVIDEATIMETFLTHDPADKLISPIEENEND